ncbi:hypothetical protein EDD11_005876 [Mortierella claussenii]|nr:hypothetical protein EDD11_005876 [Mortierella claussenii]
MFNTDSGFRPPSPLAFAPPSHGLFGEPLGYDDFKLSNQDFLNLPTSPPAALANDPSMSLFNPSEQRYFSEFLDTLVVDQDFTFDPSSIPNLPNLPLFSPETMPGGFMLDSSSSSSSSSHIFPGMSSSSSSLGSSQSMMNASSTMDFDMTSPSSQSSFGGSHSFPTPFSHGPGGDSPVSPASPSSYNNPSKRKSNKASEARRAASINLESSKITTPIQQLSKLSLSNNSNSSSSSSHMDNKNKTNGPSNPKKNKRDEDEHPTSSSPTMVSSPSRSQKEDSRERNASVSDGYLSDAPNGAGSSTKTKRKPYKELLTEEEKRANHIASEQKRRNTIRNGFKDMTDIIPDLKDVNSSKSTILFKAVDFIRHLERQNRMLQDKASRLESRLISQRNEGNGGTVGGNVGGSGLDDQRLQDIPHIYPVPCSR